MALPEPFGGLLLLLANVRLQHRRAIAVAGHRPAEALQGRVFTESRESIAAPRLLLLMLAVLSPGRDAWNRELESPSDACGLCEGDGYANRAEFRPVVCHRSEMRDVERAVEDINRVAGLRCIFSFALRYNFEDDSLESHLEGDQSTPENNNG